MANAQAQCFSPSQPRAQIPSLITIQVNYSRPQQSGFGCMPVAARLTLILAIGRLEAPA